MLPKKSSIYKIFHKRQNDRKGIFSKKSAKKVINKVTGPGKNKTFLVNFSENVKKNCAFLGPVTLILTF